MIKLVIFDLDGTLLDTLGDLAAACDVALERNGLPGHTPQELSLIHISCKPPPPVRRMCRRRREASQPLPRAVLILFFGLFRPR